MQLAGNSNRQQTYTPPLLAAILMLASLRSFSVNFRTFNMKKIITLFFYVYNFSLCNSCWRFERFYRNGFYQEARKREFLSAFRDTSKDPIDQNLEYLKKLF